jgi:hypothetical protein
MKCRLFTFTFKVRAEPFDGLVVLQTSGSSEAQCVVTQIYFGFKKKKKNDYYRN